MPHTDIHSLAFTTIDDAPLPLSDFRGKVVLVVNTASKCGFTGQYEGLEKLYQVYKDKGFVVLGVPSNDFGSQEPGDACAIKDFTSRKFQITFPLAAKEEVKGGNAHPFFKQVRSDLGWLAAPKWNFYKYLVSRDGKLVDWFASTTAPDSRKIKSAIERELAK